MTSLSQPNQPEHIEMSEEESHEHTINLANLLFGSNGWSSRIRKIEADFVDEDSNTGKVSVGFSAVVRLSLQNGTFHEAIGYGNVENCESKGKAFQKARKDAAADGLRSALHYFEGTHGQIKHVSMAPGQKETSEDPMLQNGDHAPGTCSKGRDGHEGEQAEDEFGSDPFEETNLVS
ncbi:dsRNA-binding domain-like protein [Polyplosphaeria fusca]|uniref:DsRNA-binding domain-like protein n=1 Tax=Polyplosphaeria fusca TaxID=682080 RepID=A0A9P4QGR5_9PLEO|nr:dsRNA-binding domain-like protein [Polyplosphaeria fusca]